jgi:hypothetical protein
MRPGRMRKSSLPVIVSDARCRKLNNDDALARYAGCAGYSQCLPRHRKLLVFTAPTDRPHLAAFILPSSVESPLVSPSHSRTCETLRQHATNCDWARQHCARLQQSACGTAM